MNATSKKIISGFKLLWPGLDNHQIKISGTQAYVRGEDLIYGYVRFYYGPHRKTTEGKLDSLLRAIELKVRARRNQTNKWLSRL